MLKILIENGKFISDIHMKAQLYWFLKVTPFLTVIIWLRSIYSLSINNYIRIPVELNMIHLSSHTPQKLKY